MSPLIATAPTLTVDPDALLVDILDAARALDTTNPVAEILVDDILTLHEHLSRGGARPAAWA